MFSSVTTACRGRTRFRWNSGETFQQETHRRHQKPKALLLILSSREKLPLLELHGLETSRSTFVMLYLGRICLGHCIRFSYCSLTCAILLQFNLHCLFVCSVEPVLHPCSHSIGHSLHSFPLSFASEPQA